MKFGLRSANLRFTNDDLRMTIYDLRFTNDDLRLTNDDSSEDNKIKHLKYQRVQKGDIIFNSRKSQIP